MEPRITPESVRLGLIIPSSNRCVEPQFHHWAPQGTEIYITRLRMTGRHHLPLPELLPRIAEAALLVGDTNPDLIVFHCTATAMAEGPAGEAAIIETMHRATGRRAISTATGITAAVQAFGARRLALASPYREATHRDEVRYLEASGYQVRKEQAMGLGGSDEYIAVSPQEWVRFVTALADPQVDAYIVSCANIRVLEAIAPLERELDRPVVTSNQATLWCGLRTLGRPDQIAGLGRLFDIAQPPVLATPSL